MQGIYLLLTINALATSYERRCPSSTEWIPRTRIVCPKRSPFNYFCLYNTLEDNMKEGCDGPDFDRPGHKRVFSGGFDRGLCSADRYQPIKFWTNGSSDCVYRKSICSEEGQIAVNDQSSQTDTACRCDYTKGYIFVFKPLNNCTCMPSEEDCSCVKKLCLNNYSLSPDEICVEKTQSSLDVKSICPVLQVSLDDKESDERLVPNIEVLIIMVATFVDCTHGYKVCRLGCRKKVSTEEQKIEAIAMDLKTEMKNIKARADEQEITPEKAITDYIEENRDKEVYMENVQIKLAVIGKSGVGKSTFINVIRNMKVGDPDFALTSSYGNTTKHRAWYGFPGNDMITICDLPGYGTKEVPIFQYETRMELENFDYIFVFVDFITGDDITIGQTLKTMGKKFCFVKSKLDENIQCTKKDGQVKEKAFEEVQKRALAILEKEGMADIKWYAISSHKKKIGQFDSLLTHLKQGLPQLKRESFIFALVGELTVENIEEKYKLLKSRIHQVCMEAACMAAMPVPGLDLLMNIATIVQEVKRYIKVFGFDKEFLEKVKLNPHIRNKLHEKSLFLKTSNTDALKECVTAEVTLIKIMAIQSAMSFDVFLPVIGSVISGTTAYIAANGTLNRILDRCRDDAKVLSVYYAIECCNRSTTQ